MGWRLPPTSLHDRTAIAGGLRTLHELAVAAAASGREVELRGPVSEPVLGALAEAASVHVELPSDERRPVAGEIVVSPNGGYDIARFARSLLSPAHHVIALLSPTGQSGWPFVSPWEQQSHLTVAPETLCRPEHFRAMAALGLEAWTHMAAVHELATAAGVRCSLIGNGEPGPPLLDGHSKDVPVVYLEANRWRPLAEQVAAGLRTPAQMIPESDHGSVMEALAGAQILLWPARVEGDGRLLREARARGTVVVGLSSNVYATGLEEDSGAVAVDSLEEMPPVVDGLLADPDRLRRIAQAGRRSARAQVDWPGYVERVAAAIAASEGRAEDPQASAMAAFGERIEMLVGEGSGALARVRQLDAQLAGARARVDELGGELAGARERLQALEVEWLQAGEQAVAASSALAIARERSARHIPTRALLGELARRAASEWRPRRAR